VLKIRVGMVRCSSEEGLACGLRVSFWTSSPTRSPGRVDDVGGEKTKQSPADAGLRGLRGWLRGELEGARRSLL